MNVYVIIGSGAAGVSAAQAIRQQDSAGRIWLLSEERAGYYSRPGLAYVLTGELPERSLFPFSESDFRRLGVQLLHARVVRIDPAWHRITLADGKTLAYDRLLIATGAAARRASLPGEDLDGVVKLDNLADARRILKLCRRGRRAVVVGGGITALELVEGLLARGMSVAYLLRGDRYWHNVLDETESHIVEHRLTEEGVRLYYRTEIAEILGSRGHVTAIRTQDGRTLPCDLLAVAVGVQPRLELASAAGLHVERGVRVDEFMQTSQPDIFAAGDVAEVFDPLNGRYVLHTLWGQARQEGHAAGLNMAGVSTPYCSGIAFNVTRLAGLTTTLIGALGRGDDVDLVGVARGDSETWRQLPDAIAAENHFEINRLRLLLGETTLLGAVVVGDQTLSQPLQRLIAANADITPIRQRLLQPGARLGDLIVSFYEHWMKEYAQSAAPRPT